MAFEMFESLYQKAFPFWEQISEEERNYIFENSVALTYPKGTIVHDSTECSGVFFIRSGCLRVYIMSEDGKDITLYRLHEGSMCMLSASCVLQTITFDVFIDAEDTCEFYVISGAAFTNLPSTHLFYSILLFSILLYSIL